MNAGFYRCVVLLLGCGCIVVAEEILHHFVGYSDTWGIIICFVGGLTLGTVLPKPADDQ